MTFESGIDKLREKKAIETFCNVFGGSYKKLSNNDDFKVFDKDGTHIAYVQVMDRDRLLKDAYPLPISIKKIDKIFSRRLTPVVVWGCNDGIIYGRVEQITGEIKYNHSNNQEMMAYFPKQSALKYVKFS